MPLCTPDVTVSTIAHAFRVQELEEKQTSGMTRKARFTRRGGHRLRIACSE
jgi:hypothetical protein